MFFENQSRVNYFLHIGREEDICILTRLYTSKNYGHFLLEVCDKILVAEELGFKGKYMLFHSKDAEQILPLLRIPAERVIWIDEKDAGKTYLIKRAFEIEGYNFFKSKKSLPRLVEFAENAVRELGGNDNKDYPRRLYVKRIGRRKLLEVEDILEKYGFFTIIPEEHSVVEEIQFFCHADIILLPHGVAGTNILFMKKGAALIQTFPHNWHLPGNVELAMCVAKGVLYREIVELCAINSTQNGQFRNYTVDTHLLDYILKELIGRMEDR